MLINLEHDFMNKLTDTEKNVISFINSNAAAISSKIGRASCRERV